MYKKLRSMMALMMAFVVLAGFTPVEKAFIEDSQKAAEWKYQDIDGKMKFDLTVDGEKVGLSYDIKGTSNNEDMSAYVEVGMQLQTPAELTGMIPQMPTMKVFFKDGNYYIHTGALKEMAVSMRKMALQSDKTLRPQDITPAAIEKVQEEYLQYSLQDMGNYLNGMPVVSKDQKAMNPMNNMANMDFVNNLLKDKQAVKRLNDFFYSIDPGVDSGLTKVKDQYVLKMSVEKLADYIVAYAKAFINQIDKMPTEFLPAQAKAELDKMSKADLIKQLDEGYKTFRPMLVAQLKDSNFEMMSSFKENRNDSSVKMNINVPSLKMKGDFTMTASSMKIDKNKVILPTSVRKVDFKEFVEMQEPQIKSSLVVTSSGAYTLNGNMPKEGKLTLQGQGKTATFSVKELSEAMQTTFDVTGNSVSIEQLEEMGYAVNIDKDTKNITIR